VNAIRIKWPTGHTEARADFRSKDAAEKQEARAQLREMLRILGLKS
jgi:hypothetical protein